MAVPQLDKCGQRCRGSCILGACRVKFKAAHPLQLPSRLRSLPASTCSYLCKACYSAISRL
jgi:hypothetical protein